jgi:hypothetical protein
VTAISQNPLHRRGSGSNDSGTSTISHDPVSRPAANRQGHPPQLLLTFALPRVALTDAQSVPTSDHWAIASTVTAALS